MPLLKPFRHKMWEQAEAAAPPFVPPVDTTYLAHTIAGAGADNTVILGNWLTPTTNATQANDATSWDGTPNGSNTVTGNGANGAHTSTSGLISTAGWVTFGGAFLGLGAVAFVSLFSGVNNTDFCTFDLSTGTVTTGGTAVGAMNELGGHGTGWWWCSVTFAAPLGANAVAKFNWGRTALESQPGQNWAAPATDKVLAGPFACTA